MSNLLTYICDNNKHVCRKFGDYRTRHDRIHRQVQAWRTQLPVLVDAYLAWKHGSLPCDRTTAEWNLQTLSMSSALLVLFNIPISHAITESTVRCFAHEPGMKFINETLVRNGYLGATPEQPSLAFKFNVFNVYRQLHRACPHLGIESFMRTLNNLHQVCGRHIFILEI